MSDDEHQQGGTTPTPVSPGLTLKVVLGGCVVLALVVLGVGLATNGGTQTSATVDATLAQWKIIADSSAPAGDVTFRVTNGGTMVHEMVVLKTDTPAADLPITDAGDPPVPVKKGANKVSEDDSVGETGSPDMQPGVTRVFTIKNMAPGHYVLVCNIANHYAKGMYADFTVTP